MIQYRFCRFAGDKIFFNGSLVPNHLTAVYFFMPPNHECEKEKEWGKQEQVNKTFFAHLDESKGWRISIIGIVFAIIIQIVSFASLWGKLSTQVDYHERTIDKLMVTVEKLCLISRGEAAPQQRSTSVEH
ncbi:MAG: hypothetical protein HZB36_00980 [Candidatus Omnitrophica bacterium]|nr:hypothetical protein [Candidatus Omnitrophota bacterium]